MFRRRQELGLSQSVWEPGSLARAPFDHLRMLTARAMTRPMITREIMASSAIVSFAHGNERHRVGGAEGPRP